MLSTSLLKIVNKNLPSLIVTSIEDSFYQLNVNPNPNPNVTLSHVIIRNHT